VSFPIQTKFAGFYTKEGANRTSYLLPNSSDFTSCERYFVTGAHEEACKQLGALTEDIGTFPLSYQEPQRILDPKTLLGKLKALGASNAELRNVNLAYGRFLEQVTNVFRNNPHDP
jgi:hypothetical protein